MMNARVLELIKNPESIQAEDLSFLETEMKSHPYAQSIRALFLSGTHRFNPDNYHQQLSKTAAYTTDKKILYHFINKGLVKKEPAVNEEVETVEETVEVVKSNPVYVNGERNRILFDGEENFMDDEQGLIEEGVKNEISKETETLGNPVEVVPVTEEMSEEVMPEVSDETTENPVAEEILEAKNSMEEASNEPETEIPPQPSEENSAEVNFHGTEQFMANRVVPSEPHKKEEFQLKQNVNRHEEEMKRLIAEVEAKIKAKKRAQTETPKPVEDEPVSDELSYAETMSFDVKPVDEKADEIIEEQPLETVAEKTETSEDKTESTSAENPDWKPMSLTHSGPKTSVRRVEIKKEVAKEEANPQPEVTEAKSEDRPVFNVSFFSDTVEKIDHETNAPIENKPESKQPESNVPKFINTWQSWLKLDRKEVAAQIVEDPVAEEVEIPVDAVEEDVKEKAIEKFIETEPKISKLKEESAFVVKEKTDDISHLMTETLARLYVEQRLYAKAIKAYETLKKKHPERIKFFDEKIEEIKQLRTNK